MGLVGTQHIAASGNARVNYPADHFKLSVFSWIKKGDKICTPPEGKNQTRVFHNGHWVYAAYNPGSYGRKFGDENLKHIPWKNSKDENEYEKTTPGFQK